MNRVGGLLGAVLGLAAAAGCAGGTGGTPGRLDAFGLPAHRAVTRAELLAHPESRLLYPGSHVLRRIGSDERTPPGGDEPDPAFAGSLARAPAQADALYGWYDRWLAARGYSRAAFYRTSAELSGRAWTAPGGTEQVQVAVFGAVPGGVRYEQVLVDYRVTGPPPPP